MSGVNHWLRQRYSAVGTMVACIWIVFALRNAVDHKSLGDTIGVLFCKMLFGFSSIVMIYHGTLGVGSIIRDYVKSNPIKFVILGAVKCSSVMAGTLALAATMKMILR